VGEKKAIPRGPAGKASRKEKYDTLSKTFSIGKTGEAYCLVQGTQTVRDFKKPRKVSEENGPEGESAAARY